MFKMKVDDFETTVGTIWIYWSWEREVIVERRDGDGVAVGSSYIGGNK